ncbi:hypothetical protein AB0G05_22555 [Nonomuraea wenchangensis]
MVPTGTSGGRARRRPPIKADEGLRAVAAQAGLREFIGRLPGGWDTVMTDASGDGWQHIAIARAMVGLRHGARLLIMDEPAAGLDARAEARLQARSFV